MTAIGHLSTGLWLKGRFPRAPLPLLLIAAALPDIVWATFNLMRHPGQAPLEVVQVASPFSFIGDQHLLLQPWSHALLSNLLMAMLLAGLTFVAYRDRHVASAVGLAVVGHWLLDFLVHDADVTLWPSQTAQPVGPPFVWDAAHPKLGLFSTQPLLGFALQTLVVLACTAAFLRAFPIAQQRGRLKMLVGMTLLSAASLPIFLPGGMTQMIGGSTQLVLGAAVEMLVVGWAVLALSRWAVGRNLEQGPLSRGDDEAVVFVHQLLKATGLACWLLAGVYLLQSMLDAQAAPHVGWTSVVMALLFVFTGRRLLQKNPSALWWAAALTFFAGPLVRVLTDVGRLGPTLFLLELSLAVAVAVFIRTLLQRNLAL